MTIEELQEAIDKTADIKPQEKEPRTTYQVIDAIGWRLTSTMRYLTIMDDRIHSGTSRDLEPYHKMLNEQLDEIAKLHVELNVLLRKRQRELGVK